MELLSENLSILRETDRVIVRASAPGKVILFGEHAVVYGTTAVAAALSDLRIVVTIEFIKNMETPSIELILKDVIDDDGNYAKITTNIDDLMPYLQYIDTNKGKNNNNSNSNSGSGSSSSQIRPHDEIILGLHNKYSNIKQDALRQSMGAFIYTAIGILKEQLYDTPNMKSKGYGLVAMVESKGLPLGAGLGSSAAFSVAASASLILLREILLNNSLDSEYKHKLIENKMPSKILLDEINIWAYASEVLIHGEPSGLDNTTSCHGGALKFNRNVTTSEKFQQLKNIPKINILLTNTKVAGRSTKVLVDRVRRFRNEYPEIVNPLIQSIEAISTKFLELCEVGDVVDIHDQSFDKSSEVNDQTLLNQTHEEILGMLFNINHQILEILQVGHPALSAVRNASQNAGLACKLTGAGGGGCAITLMKDATSIEEMNKLENHLQDLGFDLYRSAVGGEGVRLWS